MPKSTLSTRFVGLDVHAKTIAIAVAEDDREPARFLKTIPNDAAKLMKVLDGLGERVDLLCAYEAGPTGYGLQRKLAEAGIECQVIAPSKTPKASGDRVKTDKRDAVRLAHFLRSGDLTAIRVPDEACEAMRDLLRAREDAKRAQLRARHQLSKFLLRNDLRWPKSNWTRAHHVWIEQQRFAHPARQHTLTEYLAAVDESTARIARFDQLLERMAPKSDHAELIAALQAFRGIKLLTAASIAFELGDIRRFPTAKKLMSYLGLTPSEESSGDRVRRKGITKAGNGALRRLLTESAWAYRHTPKVAYHLEKRSACVAPGVRRIAWSAQRRLNDRYRHLQRRGKKKQETLTAVARELCGFIWAAAHEEQLVI